jgi:hypothetical protein
MVARPTLAITVLALAILACTQTIATAVPTVSTLPTLTPVPPTDTHFLPTVEGISADGWSAKIVLPTVNVREEPNGAVIDQLRYGDQVKIQTCTRSWCQISKPAGWVWRGCLSDNPERLGCQAK